jgi:hypothetical protein
METKMHKLGGLAVALLVGAAINATPADAITFKSVKDFEHPFVGLAVFYNVDGEFVWRCSGSLLTPHVFVTAGHCTDSNGDEGPGTGAHTARIYFQQDAGAHYDPVTEHDPVTGYPDDCAAGTLGVTCATGTLRSFGYPAPLPNTHDIGLVILDQPIDLPEYGSLAAAGSLDVLATRRGLQDIAFTASGYGLSYTNPAKTVTLRERLMASSQLTNLRSHLTGGFNLQTTNNPGIGGGTCFGDSGGPIFFGGHTSNIIVGVTSFGLSAQVCAGADFSYRTDRQAVIDWILSNVPAGETVQIVEI